MNDETQVQKARLTKSDLAAIELRFEQELVTLGATPTLETLKTQGYSENTSLNRALDWIAGAGRVMTLAIAEFIRAFAALGLMVVFALLEGQRIHSGSLALGQTEEKSLLLAVAFTTANIILPIYRLRNIQERAGIESVRWTVRGHLEAFWRRLIFKPVTETYDVNHNPTLHIMEGAVTWATLFLASYAVLSPMLEQYTNEMWLSAITALFTRSNIGEFLQLLAGVLVAIGGVFGVQSISHEIGVRTLIDRPIRLVDVLERKRAEYDLQVDALRQRITQDHMTAKIQEEQRKHQERHIEIHPLALTPSMNGHSQNGHHSTGE